MKKEAVKTREGFVFRVTYYGGHIVSSSVGESKEEAIDTHWEEWGHANDLCDDGWECKNCHKHESKKCECLKSGVKGN
jgi:hypothetical protein